MKNNRIARFARACFIFARFTDVLVFSTTWNDLKTEWASFVRYQRHKWYKFAYWTVTIERKLLKSSTYLHFSKLSKVWVDNVIRFNVNSFSGGLQTQDINFWPSNMVNIYVTQRNERFLLVHSCRVFISLLLHEKCCFVLLVFSQTRWRPRLHTYAIKIDYQGRRTVDCLKRTFRWNNRRRL